MGLISEFRDFVMRGNVLDLAVGVIIGGAFGKIVGSLVEDVLMPPIGKAIGNVDFSNLYISMSDKVDAKNAAIAATQPTGGAATSMISHALPLKEARDLGPVIAYGNFLTILINFLIVAFCVFMVIKLVNSMTKRFERKKAETPAAPPAPPEDVVLLREIRDALRR